MATGATSIPEGRPPIPIPEKRRALLVNEAASVPEGGDLIPEGGHALVAKGATSIPQGAPPTTIPEEGRALALAATYAAGEAARCGGESSRRPWGEAQRKAPPCGSG